MSDEIKPRYRESTMETPGQCQHCGCEPTAVPLCEHLISPTETLEKKEGKILYCPVCPLRKYHFWQIMQKKYQKLSAKTPMLNLSENDYKCQFCIYGFRA